MKKIFVFFIFAICMPCVSVYAASVGAGCTYRTADDMVDGQTMDVPCRELNLAGGAECFVYCDKGALYKGVRQCNDGYFKLNPVAGVAGMYEKCGTKKEACESFDSRNSGAHWDSVYNDCICNGNRQVWDKNTMKCTDADEYTKCNDDSEAEWDYKGGFCWCKDSNKVWFNYKCRVRSEKRTCDEIIKKLPAFYAGSIAWNASVQRCGCVAGKMAADGEKIVKPDNYYIGYIYDYAYVDKDGTPQTKRIDATVCYLNERSKYNQDSDRTANSPETAKTRGNIKTKYNALADISGKWGQSHWKTASGNFNGARLASDSVAGVVLGTVGGVITSNVIKKNQVRGGFEDINCMIGGQRVADYDDQFVVGIQ